METVSITFIVFIFFPFHSGGPKFLPGAPPFAIFGRWVRAAATLLLLVKDHISIFNHLDSLITTLRCDLRP